MALSQNRRLFASLAKVESLGNWANVISLGERTLKSLPDELPEYQTSRSKTAAAYVKRWKRCLNENLQDVLGRILIKTKRNEDPAQVIDKILPDLDRAIQLEPENAEYYYIRFSVLCERGQTEAALADLDRAIELDPSTAQYYFARSTIRQFDDQAGASRDRQRAVELGYEEPGFPGMTGTISPAWW